VTNESLLISAAIVMLAAGILFTLLERVRHPPATPLITFTGIVGVYLGLCATVERSPWLYVPCLVLLLGAAAGQLRAFRRQDRSGGNGRTGGTA
jgi:hypothetical protein